MSDESTAPADLSGFGIDLTQMFRPAWTTETGDSSADLARQFDEGDRPQRNEGRGGERGRDSRGPRPDRGAAGRGGGASQGFGSARPGGRREDQGQGRGPKQGDRGNGPKRDASPGGGDRPSRRGQRDEREQRREPEPKAFLEGWKLQLLPEASAIEGIAKQIRSRAKAYPLFELARLIVQLSDRYTVKLTADSEETPVLFLAKLDGSLWTTRKEAVNHLLSKHIGKFYQQSSVTTEAPKGAFSVVAQCGMSGVVLGPPNHHEYTSRVIALHASRFKNLPFEVYKSRIRMMRDEALIDQWKTEQSTKTVYIPVKIGELVMQAEEITTPADPTSQVPEAAESLDSEVAVAVESITEPEPQVAETPVTPEVESTPEATSDEPAEAMDGGDTAEAEESKSEKAPVEGLSLAEATAHFQEHHAETEVISAGRDLTVKGAVALHASTPLLRELLLKNLQEMDRFPLPLAQVLGKELTSRGLQLFKSHKKIINVSVARPRYLDREVTAVSEACRAILEYLEAHPKQHRDKQWASLLALRTETVSHLDQRVAELLPSEGESTPASTTQPAPDEETLRRREQALGTDLLWLLHQGHVIDFAMGNLQAATRPVPKTPPKNESPATAVSPETTAPESSIASIETISEESPQLAVSPVPSDESGVQEPEAPVSYAAHEDAVTTHASSESPTHETLPLPVHQADPASETALAQPKNQTE